MNGWNKSEETIQAEWESEIKEDKKMSQSNTRNKNIASMMIDGLKTVSVKFNEHDTKSYTYRTMLDLKVGDYGLVEVTNNRNTSIKMARVVRVHDIIEIDLDSDFEYKWLFSKVDYNVLQALKNRDEAIYKNIIQIEQKAIFERTKELMLESNKDIFKLENYESVKDKTF